MVMRSTPSDPFPSEPRASGREAPDGDPVGGCNEDGAFNVFEFTCFHEECIAGCD